MHIPSVSLFFQQAAASGSQQQPASSSVVNLWHTSKCWKLRETEARWWVFFKCWKITVERKRDGDFGSVSLCQHDKERILSVRKVLHERALQGECAVQRRLSEAEAGRGQKKLGKEKLGNCSVWNQSTTWITKGWSYIRRISGLIKHKEKTIEYVGELGTKNRIYQEHHARDCQETKELRRICCRQADRVRQLRIDELSMQKEESPSTVNQLLSQVRELQDKVNEFLEWRKRILCSWDTEWNVPRSQSTLENSESQRTD